MLQHYTDGLNFTKAVLMKLDRMRPNQRQMMCREFRLKNGIFGRAESGKSAAVR